MEKDQISANHFLNIQQIVSGKQNKLLFLKGIFTVLTTRWTAKQFSSALTIPSRK